MLRGRLIHHAPGPRPGGRAAVGPSPRPGSAKTRSHTAPPAPTCRKTPQFGLGIRWQGEEMDLICIGLGFICFETIR